MKRIGALAIEPVKLRVILTPPARAQFLELNRWWRKNRPANPGLLKQEVREALIRLALQPEGGPQADAIEPGLRKLLLPRTRYYIYYEIDHAKRTVSILAFWHTARGRRPRL
jgi:plasmid stabilization system protein ParE